MLKIPFPPSFTALLAGAFLTAAMPPLHAQTTTRQGTGARPTVGGGARATNRAVTSGGTGRSATGARQYRSNTELGDATVTVDPETRSLVIVADEETHLQLAKVIQNLDKVKPQVLIKVVFVEVTYNKGSDIGVEGSYTFTLENPLGALTGSRTSTSTTTSTANDGATTNTNSSTLTRDLGQAARVAETAGVQSLYGLASATDGSFLRVASDDWSATLRAMATRGKVEVLSRPSIMARNNQEAVIVVGSEVPFVTNSRTDALGNLTNTIVYDDVGIILRVTPFITSDGTVEMIVAPTISTLTAQTVPISSTASAPVIAKRSAETVVVTPNGQTVVIGGLMETQRVESVRKFPILGDIPLIGLAFKRTVKDDVKRELLIFLTPHIVTTAEGLDDLSSGEMVKTDLVRKAFSPKELERYLDAPSLFDQSELPADKEVTQTTVTETTVASAPITSTPPPPVVRAAPAKPTPRPVATPTPRPKRASQSANPKAAGR
ncbi:MAG TPA: hypothetical protein VF593_06980 [Chthoniobacteraceae bacterium]|jgi:general secretion pathway protein D